METGFPDEVLEDLIEIFRIDDKEKLLELLLVYGNGWLRMRELQNCAHLRAKKCLLVMILGEGRAVPAQQLYAKLVAENPQTPTPLACVACHFHTAPDIIELLFKQGAVKHVNIKCVAGPRLMYKCPLDHLLVSLSNESHLRPWVPGNPLNKLILLLCQWKTKSSLDSARLLASHTHRINDIAWTHVNDGRLTSLAALLLVAKQQVLAPFDSGLTIGQRIINLLDALSSEGDLDYEGAKYQSMLIEACKLLDIFERAGDALSLYCSSMHEYVPPDKVLIDVANVLKKADFVLQPMDIDLRDCYRGYPELWNAKLFKLSDHSTPANKYLLPSLTRAQGLGASFHKYSYVGDCCPLLHKLKSGTMLNLVPSDSMPQLLRTAASQLGDCSLSVQWRHLAYTALRLKRGIKF